MKHSSQAFLVVAALAASLSLTGCGTPEFVYALCKESLAGVMAEASADGLNTVQNQCGSTFVAQNKINLCIYEGARFLNDAKTRTMPQFRDQCAKYVEDTVCVFDSKCYKKPDKITPDMARPAVADYIATNGDSLKVRMKAVLDSKIQDIVTADYHNKYLNRAVPGIVQTQCGHELDRQLSTHLDISNQAIMAIYRTCTGNDRDSYYTTQCQAEALRKLNVVERREKDKFKMRCAKAALDKACPKGSACAIETSGANTEVTSQAAVNFMWNSFSSWMMSYKTTLMNTANGWTYYGRKFDMFTLPAWQGNTLLAIVSIAAAVGGIGCVIAVVRFARKRATRTVSRVEAPEAVELIEDLEE